MNWAEVVSQQQKKFPSFSFTFSLSNLVVVWITCLLLSTSILGSALPTSKWQSSLLTTNKISLSNIPVVYVAFAFLSYLQWVSKSSRQPLAAAAAGHHFQWEKMMVVVEGLDLCRKLPSINFSIGDMTSYRGTGILPTHITHRFAPWWRKVGRILSSYWNISDF